MSELVGSQSVKVDQRQHQRTMSKQLSAANAKKKQRHAPAPFQPPPSVLPFRLPSEGMAVEAMAVEAVAEGEVVE